MAFSLRWYQQEALDAIYAYMRKTKGGHPCAVLPTGCHAKGYGIMMFNGNIKNVEDIVVGDMLMGADGNPRNVLQLCRGRHHMYEVFLEDHSFIVNQDHILHVTLNYSMKNLDVKFVYEAMKKLNCKFFMQKKFLERKTYRHEYIFDIKPVGVGDFYGFTLDGDHLYLDEQSLVHHNSGKTPLLSQICSDVVTKWGGRVCVLAHVKELLEQAADKLAHFLPAGPINNPTVGLYSAGMNRRNTDNPVVVAGIQSVYKKAFKLCNPNPFNIIIVDECHLISSKDATMYRKFLTDILIANPNAVVIGLTATPYRLDSGIIYGGKDDIFTDKVYEAPLKQLILQGYLSPLKTKRGCEHADMANVSVRGGEYVSSEMAAKFDEIMLAAIDEILRMTVTQGRKSTLIFGASVDHGKKIQEAIIEAGYSCGFVCGDTPKDERAKILLAFKEGKLQYLSNVNVLTTGFDAPNVDCVALLRSTLSPGLYYQMVGRGLRICEGKKDCLVLDYGENVATHGPIDMIRPPKGKQSDGDGEAATKECPNCHEIVFAGYKLCPECNHEFAADTILHNHIAGNKGVVSGEINTYDVVIAETRCFMHRKRGFEDDPEVPPTLRVEFRTGGMSMEVYRKWVCIEHQGFARQQAENWWVEMCPLECPSTVMEAIELADAGVFRQVKKITVREEAGKNFPEIIGYEFGPMLSHEEIDEKLAAADIERQVMAEEAGIGEGTNLIDWFNQDDIPF